jgi:hypothetical protein
LGALATAIERHQWERAALYLLMGVTRAAAALPPEAVEGLLEVLDASSEGAAEMRRGRRSDGGGLSR